jgi:hypothetical protein
VIDVGPRTGLTADELERLLERVQEDRDDEEVLIRIKFTIAIALAFSAGAAVVAFVGKVCQ